MVLIKKYPNRRLYDTSSSQYVNLDYIKKLVTDHAEFTVVDSKSGADLTKSILLQIISEQESNDQQSLLTNSVLKQLIRYYDTDMQLFMRQYLEQSMAVFLERQDTLQGMMKDLVDASPLGLFNQIMEKNMKMWREWGDLDAPKGGEKSE
ncbi:polyhydroxyalkanoate synthesis repressor PhaR [Exilibacterium tricleocarpae]|uniref:Polyhydroxyalkanoate synthesis repressor PhaR n=1 Tax=Exilibacterium tricleocarpae TaxID=2591008 RepID=A0A545SMD3_9GAMM|nr:polyhydroxyalkanoate synthesis repressor PhaR [Exilibacterium tricleocarpae]TQV66139.1 polyhydroxyalkanoate synthesis repressor PhaR [Exilibacterium tricleocarpae]